MDVLTPVEILDYLDQLIRSLERDENLFFVALDVAYQLRDELTQILTDSDN